MYEISVVAILAGISKITYLSFMCRSAPGASPQIRSTKVHFDIPAQQSACFHIFGIHIIRHSLTRARKTIFSAIYCNGTATNGRRDIRGGKP